MSKFFLVVCYSDYDNFISFQMSSLCTFKMNCFYKMLIKKRNSFSELCISTNLLCLCCATSSTNHFIVDREKMSCDLDEFLRLCLIILFPFKNKNKILYIIHAYQLPLIMRAYFNENQNRKQEV